MAFSKQSVYPSPARAWGTVFILMIALVLAFVDRQVISLLVGPIRNDLAISDTQISLLMGAAFALFYTVAGIPLGRLADSRSRKGVIGAGIFAWSLMTAFCGLATQFWHLLVAKIGVAVGEASLTPAAYSVMADSFPPAKRGTAFAVYQMGIFLGSGLAFLLGGIIITFATAESTIVLPVLGEVAPWRFIFISLGVLGLLFCLTLFALKEPVRQGESAGVSLPLREVGAYFSQVRRAVSLHNLGFAFIAFATYGAQAWMPTFLMRSHGLSPAEVGINYGLIVLTSGPLGVICGGRIADYFSARGMQDAYVRIALIAVLCALPFNIMYLVSDIQLVWVLFGLNIFFIAVPFGLAPAALQEIMPNPMRGQASALYVFTTNIIGLGLGPTAVALMTDYFFKDDLSLRYSLIWVATLSAAFGVCLLFACLKPFRVAKARLSDWSRSPLAK